MPGISRGVRIFHHISRALPLGAAFGVVLGVVLGGAAVAVVEARDVFSAVALTTGGPNPAIAERLTFAVDRWTTADEAQTLADTLKREGPRKMFETLHDLKSLGTISTPGSIGYPLQYAVQEARPDGGLHVILMTDRPMSFAEAWAQPRTVDYPVTYIELEIDKNGKGTGKMLQAARLISAGKLIVVEEWGVPIQLTQVKHR